MISYMLEDNKQYIINEYNNGKSMDKLGKEFGCNSGTIYYKLKEWNIKTRPHQKFNGKISDYHNDIIKRYNSGDSCYKIGKDLNISNVTIGRYLNKLGYDVSKKMKQDLSNLLKNKSNEVCKLYRSGKSSYEISKIIGHSQSQVWKILRDNNIKIRPNNKYEVNEQFFDKIDSEQSAYAYGLLLADGSVNAKTGVTRIALKEDDRHVLEDLKRIFGFTGELYYKPQKGTSCPQYELGICRKSFTDRLIKLGCKPNKSLVLGFDSLDCVPKNLIKHAIRGYLDGDGSICVDKASICCTNHFAQNLNIFVKNKLDIEGKFYYRNKNKNSMGSWQLNKKNSKIFLDWLYKDATIYLKRKHDRYLRYYTNMGV